MAFPKSSGGTNCVFGTEDLNDDDLGGQFIESFNLEMVADQLEIKDNEGKVIGRFWFNPSGTGSFTLYHKSTGGFALSEIGDVKAFPVDGTNYTVEITTQSITKVNDNIEKRAYQFIYNPGIVRA